MTNFKEILSPEDRSEYLKEFEIEDGRVAVLATDWVATGQMVQETFPVFPITGNPQKEITGKDRSKIILSKVFSEEMDQKILIPFGEKLIHKVMANKGSLVRQLGKEVYKEKIKGKIKKAAEEDLSYVFPYQCFPIDFDFFEEFGLEVLASSNFSTLNLLSNKVHFYKFLERKGITRIEGSVVSNKDEALDLFEDLGGNAYATKERGAGGAGSYHLKTKEDVREIFLNYEGKILMQEWVKDIKASPNVLAVIPRGDISQREVAVILISDQIISGTRYEGNVFPTSVRGEAFKDLVRLVKKIGVELAKIGYVGMFGLDGLVTEEGDVFPVELNLRVNHSHGTAGLIYSKLRPDMPPLMVLHTAAALEKGWLDNEELNKLPIEPREMDKYYYIKNFRAPGWRRTSNFSLDNGIIPVGFPEEGWLIPPIGSYSKIGGDWLPNEPMFLGRLLISDQNLKSVRTKMIASKIKILKKYKTLDIWRW